MNHQSSLPHIPPVPNYPSRRQGDYHYPSPSHHQQAHHVPYQGYHHAPQYHAPMPMHHYPQQWYQPYPHFAPQPISNMRPYQQQAPLVVSSHPHAQPVVPVARQPLPTAQSFRPSQQPEQSTPSTTSQALASPSPTLTPTSTSVSTYTPPIQAPKSSAPVTPAQQVAQPPQSPQPPLPMQRMPFYPQLPWLSVPDATFPSKTYRKRRKRKTLQPSSDDVQLPSRNQLEPSEHVVEKEASMIEEPLTLVVSTATDPSTVVTPQIPQPASDAAPTNDMTPTSATPMPASNEPAVVKTHKRNVTKPIVPVIPIKPIITTPSNSSPSQQKPPVSTSPAVESPAVVIPNDTGATSEQIEPSDNPEAEVVPSSPPIKQPPKSWAELLRNKALAAKGAAVAPLTVPSTTTNGTIISKTGTLADALNSYSVENDVKLCFLEPRGLVNTGNMCYMNSILQTLVFCIPFYDFLDQIGKRAVHNFKSDTPLVEAMIMFMREFNIIDSAVSVEQLRMRLKENELEKYGDAFIPEYVYDVIKRLPRFSSMRRGHQQDAEEFLGFLLEGLHDECVHVMKKLNPDTNGPIVLDNASSPVSEASTTVNGSTDVGWLEVGPKQKAAVTRSSGTIVTESPVTKIFGGKLRSEFRVPGLQNSVTLEPYQPLQLDIGDPTIHNITDALKGLTRSETLHGDFKSPRGANATATKQVFIETLPPVLILHLKRFQYDNTGGTQKIWKKIGYPLELEIPKEVFPPHKRGVYAAQPGGLPKYRLIGVVYHHGKNASGGHYTVDVRRQEGREWIRLDDTIIRRVRSDDVAGEGGEEDPKILAKALEQHKRDEDAGRNIYKAAGFENGEDDEEEDDAQGAWSQVNGDAKSPNAGTALKKWSGLANGTGTATPSTAGKQTPRETAKYSVKDNKVAYILFYQRIKP